MAESHVLHSLKEKRARIAGELVEASLRVLALKTDLASIDACLKIFDRNIDPETIPAKKTRTPSGWLPKGACTRTALEILRETGEAMSSQEFGRVHPPAVREASGGPLADLGGQCAALEFQPPEGWDSGVRQKQLSGEVAAGHCPNISRRIAKRLMRGILTSSFSLSWIFSMGHVLGPGGFASRAIESCGSRPNVGGLW
jgi:DNA-binding CsgD family transcriptional regulator